MSAGQCGLCCAHPPAFLCYCTSPRAQLCSLCAVTHFQLTEKAHRPVAYWGEPAHRMCGKCAGAKGTVSCKCEHSVSSYCSTCFDEHVTSKAGVHDSVPAGAADFLEQSRPVEEFFERQKIIDGMEALLRGNVGKVEQCKAAVRQLALDLTDVVEHWRVESEATLDSIAKVIEGTVLDCIRVLEPHRYRWEITATTKLEQILYESCFVEPTPTTKDFSLFSWEMHPESVLSPLLNILAIDHSTSLLSAVKNIYYFVPWSNHLLRYSLPSIAPTTIPVRMKHNFKSFSAWCDAGSGRLCVSGGYKHTAEKEQYFKEAKLVTVSLRVATPIPNLNVGRCRHGMVALPGGLFAFGGFAGSPLKSIEKYDWKREEWTEVAEMTEGKDCASVAVWRNKAYIVGYSSRKIEVFDPAGNRLSQFSVKLKSIFANLLGPRFVTLLGTHENELVLLLEEELLTVNLITGVGAGEKLPRLMDKSWFCQCAPVVVNGRWYLFTLDQEFWTVEMTKAGLEYISRVVV